MKVLVIDVGGTHIKVLCTGKRTPLKLPSGPKLTARQMVKSVLDATAAWDYDVISIGFPGPVRNNVALKNPINLGKGWARFDFRKAFGKPVKLVNDAAMQAIGSYQGGHMLFLGLGTGLGTTMISNGTVIPLEVAHLPYRKDKSYEDIVGDAAMKHLGKHKWKRHVEEIISLFIAAFNVEYVVLGGGNVRHLSALPPKCRRGGNENAFGGGYDLWKKDIRIP